MDILIAGFGGQGILFAGKLLVNIGLAQGKQVSWLPSYGPEMRGGTCSCSVCISDEPIGSPLVSEPDVLIAMNMPSYEKFIGRIHSGGVLILDSSMADPDVQRKDITVIKIPATSLADSIDGIKGGANMILMGKFLADFMPTENDQLKSVFESIVPSHKSALIESNIKALSVGAGYICQD